MNKTVLITGAGRGLGFCVTQKHLQLKDRVYAMDNRITDELKALADENVLLRTAHCDIADDQSVAEATKEILKNEEQVDIIYNAAGIFLFEERVGLSQTNMDECLRMYNINALGAMRVCKALWPLIQSGSVVVNISSESGSIGAARRTKEYGYGMSKAAMNMGAKLLSNELWSVGARVMNLHPGWMRTAMGGAGAMASSDSVSPEESAADIVGIALGIGEIPRDQMYMTHKGIILPW